MYLYILSHNIAYNYNDQLVYKIGSTKYIDKRYASYKTYYPIMPNIVCYYRLNNYDAYVLDDEIKMKFSEYNIKDDGGIEFYYQSLTPNKIEEYMRSKNIVYEKKYKIEKVELNRKDKIELVEEENNKTILFPFQNIIKSKTINYFENNDKGILNLFCRIGKTIISCLIVKHSNFNKILILVPSLYLIDQTYNKWKEYYDTNYLLISHEEEYNIDEFYNKYNKFLIICTYQSSYKLQKYKFDMCIYDEAHRTTGNIKDTYYQSLLKSNNIRKKLFLTATMKEYSYNKTYSMDDKEIYGNVIESISAKQAIELKRIVPYQILLMNIDKENIVIPIQNLSQELRDIYPRYYKIAYTLLETIKKYNIKHIITYHSKIIYAQLFKKILENLGHKNVDYICGEHKKISRNMIIQKFQDNESSILCSAKVLQEGVDIPKCDAICFVDFKSSVIDTIQSLSRCLTKINNKEKGYIIIPFEDTTNIKDDIQSNNLRIILRNIMEVDENLREYIMKYEEIMKTENNTNKNEINVLNEKYNINFDIKLFSNLRELAYEPYSVAKQMITNKYYSRLNYIKNVEKDFENRLPKNPDMIYKKFGWINWNDYLNIETTITNNKIQKIIWKYNKENIIIDSKEKYKLFAIDNDLPINISPLYENWLMFLLEDFDNIKNNYYTIQQVKDKKIKNIEEYKQLELIDNKIVPYNWILDGFYNYNNQHFNMLDNCDFDSW
jgi:predicted helicase